jgi:hypothetical protein
VREDIPEWLGKPPLRGTEKWDAWLAKWRQYARVELRDTAADDPDFDFGLLTVDERWRVALQIEVRSHITAGRAGAPPPMELGKRISDLHHASVVAWMVGRSVLSPLPDARDQQVAEWSAGRENPRRRRIAHGIRYGFIAGLGGDAASPSWSSPDYVAAYEAAWAAGNELAIENDPR